MSKHLSNQCSKPLLDTEKRYRGHCNHIFDLGFTFSSLRPVNQTLRAGITGEFWNLDHLRTRALGFIQNLGGILT